MSVYKPYGPYKYGRSFSSLAPMVHVLRTARELPVVRCVSPFAVYSSTLSTSLYRLIGLSCCQGTRSITFADNLQCYSCSHISCSDIRSTANTSTSVPRSYFPSDKWGLHNGNYVVVVYSSFPRCFTAAVESQNIERSSGSGISMDARTTRAV